MKLSDLPPAVRQLAAAQAPSVQSATFTVPYPPSVNTYWRHVGRKVLISAEGRAYRHQIDAAVLEAGSPHLTGKLYVGLTICPPDHRRRDLDNCCKALLDAMQGAGVYEDDSQIDILHLIRGEVFKGGQVKVEVKAI